MTQLNIATGKAYKPWQFKPGQSGNPEGGRARFKPSAFNAQELARAHTKESIQTLVHYMRQRKAPAIALRAAEILLNRAWGIPSQDIKLNTDITVSIAAIVHDARQRVLQTIDHNDTDAQAVDQSDITNITDVIANTDITNDSDDIQDDSPDILITNTPGPDDSTPADIAHSTTDDASSCTQHIRDTDNNT
jgi:hypothetical protein